MSIEPEALIGRELQGVSSSWHDFAGERSGIPVHVWLRVAGLGTMSLYTLNGLKITEDHVGEPADMGVYGGITIEASAPHPLRIRVGHRIADVSRLHQAHPV